jgi:hypothetical protein
MKRTILMSAAAILGAALTAGCANSHPNFLSRVDHYYQGQAGDMHPAGTIDDGDNYRGSPRRSASVTAMTVEVGDGDGDDHGEMGVTEPAGTPPTTSPPGYYNTNNLAGNTGKGYVGPAAGTATDGASTGGTGSSGAPGGGGK